MVDKNNEENDVEIEITNDEHSENNESEIEEIEGKVDDKLKKVKDKLKVCEEEKKKILDESQLAKADFLNARKRLEEERVRDRLRNQINHIEDLLPLCDSFQMAMSNKETWEKADKAWRTGIEAIHTQLQKLLERNNVKIIESEGMDFDPHRHEAMGHEAVTDESQKDKVVSVLQQGYEMKVGDKTEIIRPARVMIGEINK